MPQLETSLILKLTGNIEQQAAKYSRSFEQLGTNSSRSMSALGNHVSNLSDGIDRLGNRAVLGIGGLAVAFKATFLNTAAEFERMQMQMETLEGSSAKAQVAMSWITDFATRTPLELQEVTTAYARLKQFGLDPTNGSLQSLVDQNAKMAGSADTLQGMILAVGQAWTKQKLQAEEANQLIERGVPVWDLLSKSTGKSAEQLMKAASAGKLGRKYIALLLEEIGKNSAGASEKFAKSWDGMLSNMSDQWTLFQKRMMEKGAFDSLKNEVNSLLDEINRLNNNGQLDIKAQELSDALVTGVRVVKELGTGVAEVMKAVGNGVAFVAEKTGGYENLGKILAAVYLANKALRVAAPVAGVAGKVLGAAVGSKTTGNPLLDAATGMKPVPVFVVNGMGGLADKGNPLGGNQKKMSTYDMLKKQKLGDIAGMGGPAVLRAAGFVGLAGAAGYTVGTAISEAIEGTDLSNWIGRQVAKGMSLFSDDAKAALNAETKANQALAAERKAQLTVAFDMNGAPFVKRADSRGFEVNVEAGGGLP